MRDSAISKLTKAGYIARIHDVSQDFSVSNKSKVLRFIPKLKGMRPIYIPKKVGHKNSLAAKLFLSELIRKYDDSRLKIISRFSINSVWSKYVSKLQSHYSDKPLYIIKVDITDAFGSVLHSKLLEILNSAANQFSPVIKFGCYQTRKSLKTESGKKFHILLNEKGYPLQPLWKGSFPLVSTRSDPVSVTIAEVLGEIKSYIVEQTITAGRKLNYKILKGIAQGGSLSTDLCTLYYAAMYDKFWKASVQESDLLLQSVDDFIFFSPCKKSAQKFLNICHFGSAEFNCFINPSKTVENVSSNGQKLTVKFSTVTFCTHSRMLLVSASQIASCPPRYSMKLNCQSNPGNFLVAKLKQIVSARATANVLDPSYTNFRGLLHNCFRIGFMTGARLKELCKWLFSSNQRDNTKFYGKVLFNGEKRLLSSVNKLWRTEIEKRHVALMNLQVVAAFLGK